jgi:hypothetical protein
LRIPVPVLVLPAVLLMAACSATPQATTSAPPTPTATAAPTGSPAGGVGDECAGIPRVDRDNPTRPSFSRDPELEAVFPRQVDGQPVVDIQSMRWVEFVCWLAGQEAIDQQSANMPGSMNLSELTFGRAEVSIDDEDISIVAVRSPGNDAAELLEFWAVFSGGLGSDDEPAGTLTSRSLGGKTVSVWTSADGEETYLYAVRDVMIGTADETTVSQLNKLFAALPER